MVAAHEGLGGVEMIVGCADDKKYSVIVAFQLLFGYIGS